MRYKRDTISDHRWHSEERYWSFPDTGAILEKILKVFGGEKIYLDPALQSNFLKKPYNHCEAKPQQSQGSPIPLLVKGQNSPSVLPLIKGDTEGFEDLRHELILRKYSYKTVKSCIYFNRDFLNFSGKNPSLFDNNDI